MAAPSEENLICDKFNLEALTVNQVKSFKSLADGKDVFIGTKTGNGIFASKYILDPPRVERRGTRIVTLG
jgi:hypothetical protein